MVRKRSAAPAVQSTKPEATVTDAPPQTIDAVEITTAPETGDMTITATPELLKSYVHVGVYKLNDHAEPPEYATDGSMCFDIKACLDSETIVTGYNKTNEKFTRPAVLWNGPDGITWGVSIDPGDRILMPTGLIFDLPEGSALMLYPRSGISLKQGVTLGNCVGVVDSDYVEQTFVILENTSSARVYVMHGDRVCQGEVVQTPPKAKFVLMAERPAQKTNRNGGFGSTGK